MEELRQMEERAMIAQTLQQSLSDKDGRPYLDADWIAKHILKLSDEQIKIIPNNMINEDRLQNDDYVDEMAKMDLINARLQLAKEMMSFMMPSVTGLEPQPYFDISWVAKHILKLTDEEINANGRKVIP